jgi:hypothetical protein
MDSQMIFIAADGDSIGSRVGRAVLADDIEGIKDISQKIEAGQAAIEAWATSYGAEHISHGGDESSYRLPAEALDTLEQARKDYEYATGGMSCTVGVGMKLSEAGKALLVGKLRGKDQICNYDQSVEQEYAQAEQDTANGTATGEAAKLGHAYMQKDQEMTKDTPQPEAEDSHADCPYCEDLNAQGDSDPDHCSSCHDEGDDCPYCNESDEEGEHDPSSPDHTDDCPYCEDDPDEDKADAAVGDPDIQGEADKVPSDDPSITDDPSEHTKEGMQDMLNEIVNQDGEGNSIEGKTPEDMDDSVEPVSGDMQGNVSRPDGYDSGMPGDMGLDDSKDTDAEIPNEESQSSSPDFGSVLKDGLEDHAGAIQKERVMAMVVEALQGFKANKDSLERAKSQVPGLYTSSIAMLRAMIEMGKLLGLEDSPESQPMQPVAQPKPAAPAGAPTSPKLLG